MINPIKRAAIGLAIGVAIVTGILCIPGLRASKLADFCKGLSVGLGGACAIVMVILLAKRRNLKSNEQKS